MPDENPIQLSPDLLNDFYAECDEHLHSARQSIVALEKGGDEKQASATIDKLFRAFHSLKGIIGMVGIRPAEQLAHRTEDYLREISRNKERLSDIGLDQLASAIQFLETSVVAFRDQTPAPDPSALLGELGLLISGISTETKLTESEPTEKNPKTPLEEKIDDAVQKGFSVWKITFIPSPALNERGVNVNEIRERLGQWGEIIHSAPRIDEGTIAFDFFVAAQELPATAPDWEKDGVRFESVRMAAPVSNRIARAHPAPAQLYVATSQYIRVELNRLDELMRITGELVIQRARLEEQIKRLESKNSVDLRGLQEVNLGFTRQFRELRETVMRLRMVPIAEIFDRMPFVVRDLTRGTRKKVRLDIQGQQTELDKFVVERLKDPLLHLVRNAVSHGMEDSEERRAAGKPEEATLTLTATTAGEIVVIEVRDDGRGLNRKKIAERALQMGLSVPENPTSSVLLDFICRPGFSTREEADRAAGRGVGMAVVSNTLRELGGSLMLEESAKGTHFIMRLPLTLLITDALIVSADGHQFAIPQTSVEEVLQIEENKVRRIEQSELVSVRGQALPLVRLRSVFGFAKSERPMPSVLVSQTERGRVGLVVDRINGQRQIVVRSLRDPLTQVPGVIGATELGDGKPLLILDPLALARRNENPVGSGSAAGKETIKLN